MWRCAVAAQESVHLLPEALARQPAHPVQLFQHPHELLSFSVGLWIPGRLALVGEAKVSAEIFKLLPAEGRAVVTAHRRRDAERRENPVKLGYNGSCAGTADKFYLRPSRLLAYDQQ